MVAYCWWDGDEKDKQNIEFRIETSREKKKRKGEENCNLLEWISCKKIQISDETMVEKDRFCVKEDEMNEKKSTYKKLNKNNNEWRKMMKK